MTIRTRARTARLARPLVAYVSNDVQASRAPEVTLVLRSGEARVSRAVDHTLGARPERARRGGRREAPHSRGSTSLSATLLKLHRTAAFSAVLAANRNA